MDGPQRPMESPDDFELPDGTRIIRPPHIKEGTFVSGWVINPTQQGRVIIDFTAPRATPEKAAGQGDDHVMEVVERIWMTDQQFSAFIQTILAMIQQAPPAA